MQLYVFSRDTAFPITSNDLLLLSSIREIDGYLSIQGLDDTEFTNLRFLRHLEVIRGMETYLFFGRRYTMIVQNNPHLQTLNLASLHQVANGGIRVAKNEKLCLADTIAFEDYQVNSTQRRILNLGTNCSGECLMTINSVYCNVASFFQIWNPVLWQRFPHVMPNAYVKFC